MAKLVPLNDLSRVSPEHLAELVAISGRVLGSGKLVLGPNVAKFEAALALYLGVNGVVGVGNGTDALILAMLAAGVGPGDTVITVANAGSYATIASKTVGAEPIYSDVDEGNLQMTVETLLKTLVICEGRKIKPKAIVLTHLFGLLNPQVKELVTLAHNKGLVVIEDCAQAIGARLPLGRAGSFGDLSTFSFYPTKNLGAAGDGGAVVSNDPLLLNRIISLREYGWGEKYQIEMSGGRNSRLDELQAAILLFKLGMVDDINKKRRNIYSRYIATLSDSFQSFAPIAENFVAHLAVFSSRTSSREKVAGEFKKRFVSTGVHYPVLDVHQKIELKYRALVPLPVTLKYLSTIFTVPLFSELTDLEVETVASALAREV
jgi:dTDP-4-amino-4,6-dideoxygalactose transaminase